MSEDLAYSGPTVEFYDALYEDKDYGVECDFLEELFEEFAARSVDSVLDLGCGTGGHLVRLAERGYEVTGIDISPEMIDHVRSKCENVEPSPEIHRMEIDSMDLAGSFDAAIGMFSVLNYLTSNRELQQGLERIAEHLCTDGLLIADIWYGPAVLHLEPEPRLKVVQTEEGQLFRFAQPTHRPREHLIEIDYEFVLAGESTTRFSESHALRYLFPKELEWYLDEAGLELLTLIESFNRGVEASLDTWSVTLVATPHG